MTNLDGRHALVTGGGRGIGQAIAAALSGAGATVTVLGRDEGALAAAVARGIAHHYALADVTDAGATSDAIARAATRGAIDILVANAGGVETAPFARTEPAQFRRLFEVNVMGIVHAAQAVLGAMTARKFGRIVAVSSTAGLKGYPYVSGYCAAKHAVVGLVRSLAIESAGSGITVNAVCPGYTDTELVQTSIGRIVARTGRSREDVTQSLLKDAPLKRLVRPEEVGAAVAFLCSEDAAAITGTAMTVAGGEI